MNILRQQKIFSKIVLLHVASEKFVLNVLKAQLQAIYIKRFASRQTVSTSRFPSNSTFFKLLKGPYVYRP